jgi:hypothetical protein
MLLRFLIVFATDCHFCFSKVAKWTGAGLVDAVVKGTGGRGIFRVQRLERRQQRESTEGESQPVEVSWSFRPPSPLPGMTLLEAPVAIPWKASVGSLG